MPLSVALPRGSAIVLMGRDGALPGNWRWRATRERQRPRWLLAECLGAEEDLGVPERAV